MYNITSELAEEIGWHIGDGSMNFYIQEGKEKGIYQLRGHIEDDKQHYIERIKPIFDKIYNTNISLREMPATRVFGFQIWNSSIVKFKHSLGLPLGKKWELQIPQVFLNNQEYIKSCIRGIFDTDGGLYLENKNNKLYPRIYISTISIKLAEQLVSLFNRFKFKSTKYVESAIKKGNRVEAYKIEIRGVDMLHKFMNEISPKNPKHIAKYNLFIKSIPKT